MRDWYESRSKKRRKKAIIIVIAVLLAAAIGTAAFFIAAKSAKNGVLPPVAAESTENPKPVMPEDYRDFFNSYYTSTTTDKADIKTEMFEGDLDFELDLKEPGNRLTLQELYNACYRSIVAIEGYSDDNIAAFVWGTGVIMSSDGVIVTNTHVIDGCDTVEVILYDDSRFDARVVGADTISDLAVLKIDTKGLPAAEFGDSTLLTVGDDVAAIGNPLGDSFRLTLTNGIISGIERGMKSNGHSMTLLQTNTALNSGNSGGALFNMSGQVVGITNMKMSSNYSTTIEGIGFAIPSTTVRNVVNEIVLYGAVQGRTAIGITVGSIPAAAAEYYDIPEGLYVIDVNKGSDAEKQGMKPSDIILEANGAEVKTTDEIGAIKDKLSVGDNMEFKIWRDGETFDISITLMDTNDIYG